MIEGCSLACSLHSLKTPRDAFCSCSFPILPFFLAFSASWRENAFVLSHHSALITDYCFATLREDSVPYRISGYSLETRRNPQFGRSGRINYPAASVNNITSHRSRHTGEGRCPRTNYWIPACAGMTTFAASCGESNPQRLNLQHGNPGPTQEIIFA
jgi:hypothetical protein